MSAPGSEQMDSGPGGTWQSLGILAPSRTHQPHLNPQMAALAEHQRLSREIPVLLADGRLPTPPKGQAYFARQDGPALRFCTVAEMRS